MASRGLNSKGLDGSPFPYCFEEPKIDGSYSSLLKRHSIKL